MVYLVYYVLVLKGMGNSKEPQEGFGLAGCEGLGSESSRACLTRACIHAGTFSQFTRPFSLSYPFKEHFTT